MAEKRYYWLKLHKDFFKQHKIRIIEDMPNGKDYILFYLKLLVESVTHNGRLRFSDTIPYNQQMLATITSTNIDVVKAAMQVFIELHMIEILDDETIYMSEVNTMIGSESEAAEKKRLQRAKKQAAETCYKDFVPKIGDIVGTLSGHCPTEIRDNSIDNRDKNIECDKKSYGKYNNVFLTADEYAQLTQKKETIERLSFWLHNHPDVQYADHYSVVLQWAKEDAAKTSDKKKKLKRDPSFDIDEIKRKAMYEEDYDI